MWSAPTPKSKPSRTKKPTQKTATTMKQIVCRFMGSVGESGGCVGCFAWLCGLCVGLSQAVACVAEHEDEVGDAEDDERQHEQAQADRDVGGADRGGVRVGGLLQALHDPGLPS